MPTYADWSGRVISIIAGRFEVIADTNTAIFLGFAGGAIFDGVPDVAATQESFFGATSYTLKVQQQMWLGDFHAFPESVTAFEDAGTETYINGADGQLYKMLQIPGGYQGDDGMFEFIQDMAGNINHRMFAPY